jgi:GYF domain 2
MSNDLWRWADPNGQQRKVRLDELRAALAEGHIAPNTPVWRSGWHAWQPAHEVPELSSASLGGANGVVLNIPPPPLAMVAVQQEYEASSGGIAPKPSEEEPPPPPAYVPAPTKSSSIHPSSVHPSSGHLKTQLGGSAYVPVASSPGPSAPGSSPGSSSPVPVATGSAPLRGASLPTTIGIPPPPEVLLGAAKSRSAAPPVPPRAHDPMIEELSSSMLLDSSSPDLVAINGDDGALLAPADPAAPMDDGDEAIAGLPRRPGLDLILDDIAAIRQGRPPKNKLLVGVLAVVALSVVIMLLAGIVSLASGTSGSDAKTAAASSSSPVSKGAPPQAATSAAAMGTTAAATSPIPPPPPAEVKSAPVLGDCTAAGDSKTIAPRAVIASAIEAHALGNGLALGFAAAPRDAVATSLDPASLAPTATVRTKATGGDARRVTPMLVGSKLTAVPDVDRKGDHLVSRRTVHASTLIDIGFADGNIVWAPHGKDSFAKLFSVDGDGPVEALRAVALADRKGIALTFRRGNAIHVGVAKGDSVLEADGPLSKITGLGQVGSPAIASSGDQVVVAWADRAGAGEDWKIRWTRLKSGSSTSEASTFAIPEGGLGEQAMSPSIAALGGGRFLLAWTEGPVSNHQVRAMTMGADGTPSGSPIAISAAGVNAGQPAAVVGPDGRGAVAFLAARGKALEVHATPIGCAAR